MKRKLSRLLANAFALTVVAASAAQAQTAQPRFSFRSGQSMYIVAFRHTQYPVVADETTGTPEVTRRELIDYDLDTERKVRKEVEGWRFFRVVDKPSDADFIFLVSIDDSSIEGLALPLDAYRQHFKEKYDLDDLRESAHARVVAGPLNIPTISRLTARLVKQFREKVAGTTVSK